jgi:hypothetical protein
MGAGGGVDTTGNREDAVLKGALVNYCHARMGGGEGSTASSSTFFFQKI